MIQVIQITIGSIILAFGVGIVVCQYRQTYGLITAWMLRKIIIGIFISMIGVLIITI